MSAMNGTPGTKDRILDAAEKLFAEQGFSATSLRGITTEAGVNLAAVFNAISSDIHIKQYQVVQEAKGEATVLIVEDVGFDRSDRDLISNSLYEHTQGKLAVELRSVDDIPLTEAGKRRSFISRLEVGPDG